VTVLRSILTILSRNGIKKYSPDPFGPPWMRPRRKMTPRSCSLTILITLVKMNLSMSRATIAEAPRTSACNKTEITNTPF
jgi:hypothetical protein